MSNDELDSNKGVCKVCQGPAAGLYFGAIVCLPCKVNSTKYTQLLMTASELDIYNQLQWVSA